MDSRRVGWDKDTPWRCRDGAVKRSVSEIKAMHNEVIEIINLILTYVCGARMTARRQGGNAVHIGKQCDIQACR